MKLLNLIESLLTACIWRRSCGTGWKKHLSVFKALARILV
jgi:hypothetical protein